MIFNWENFLREKGIDYRTEGPTVAKGNISINCPFCTSDSKFFLGINISNGKWGCWWSPEHRGINPAKLVQKLINCSWSEACKIVGGDTDIAPGAGTLEDLERQIGNFGVEEKTAGFRVMRFPLEFRKIERKGITEIAWNYLCERRGFNACDVDQVCADYNLRYAIAGDFQKRVILPFLHRKRALIGWQGRSIGKSNLRYLTHPKSVKQTLFGFGTAMEGGRVLVVVEGPFGVCKVDFYGKKKGIRAVAVAGVAYTDRQVAALFKLCPGFEKVVVLFDPEAEVSSMQLCNKLSVFGAVPAYLPDGLGGPDDLFPDQVVDVVEGAL